QQASLASPVPVRARAARAPTPAAPEAAVTAAAAAASSSIPAAAVEGASDDMEDSDAKSGLPRGWNVQARYKPQVSLLNEGGNHFLRLTNPDASKIVFVDRKIMLDPSWVAVTVSARMRSTDFK